MASVLQLIIIAAICSGSVVLLWFLSVLFYVFIDNRLAKIQKKTRRD